MAKTHDAGTITAKLDLDTADFDKQVERVNKTFDLLGKAIQANRIRAFLGGVLVGVLLASGAWYFRDQTQTTELRLQRIENYLNQLNAMMRQQ